MKRSSFKQSVKILLTGIFLGAVLAVSFIYIRQDQMVYLPHPYGPNAETVSTRRLLRVNYHSGAGDQIAFYAPPKDETIPKRVWLLFGGNGALGLQYHKLIEQPELANSGMLLIDYPGYGYNQGKPSGVSIQESANMAVAALAAQLNITPEDLLSRSGVMGHSLGTGVALEFAVAHPEIHRVLLVAPFTSLYDMAYRVVGPIAHLLHHNFDNEGELHKLEQRTPRPAVEIFTGTRDQVIPVTMSRKLKAENPWVIYSERPDYEHNHIVTEAAHELAVGPLTEMP